MSTLELVLNMLAEATTTEISKQKQPETFEENSFFFEREVKYEICGLLF